MNSVMINNYRMLLETLSTFNTSIRLPAYVNFMIWKRRAAHKGYPTFTFMGFLTSMISLMANKGGIIFEDFPAL